MHELIRILEAAESPKEKIRFGMRRNREKLVKLLEAIDKKTKEAGGGSTDKLLLNASARRSGITINESIMELHDEERFRFQEKLDRLLNKIRNRTITRKEFDKRVRILLKSFHTQSWNRGIKALDPSDAMLPSDIKQVEAIVRKQMKFAKDMGKQLADGDGTMPLDKRAGMYARALDGSLEKAMVSRLVNVNIYWRLTARKNCATCISLAASSPFTRHTLPTTPRAGDTICIMNCKCFLEIGTGKPKPRKAVELQVKAVIGKGGIDFSIESVIDELNIKKREYL